MYQVIIKNSDGNQPQDYFTRKSDVIRFIARETGVSQKSMVGEIETKGTSLIYRDSDGFRVEVYYQ